SIQLRLNGHEHWKHCPWVATGQTNEDEDPKERCSIHACTFNTNTGYTVQSSICATHVGNADIRGCLHLSMLYRNKFNYAGNTGSRLRDNHHLHFLVHRLHLGRRKSTQQTRHD
ncbi:hypothetical protein AB1N83_003836, partial [Pleurotus pulmonarius]